MVQEASSSTLSPVAAAVVEDGTLVDHVISGSASSSSKIGRGRGCKRKRRDKSRSRSPLHSYSEEQAIELFGPTLTLYSICGPPGGFCIGTANLQCLPEDNGRATYTIQLDGDMAHRLADETQRARDELLGTKSGSVSTRNARARRRRHVQAANVATREDKQDEMSNPEEPNESPARTPPGRRLKRSTKKVRGVGSGKDESSLPATRKKHRRVVSNLTNDGEPESNSEIKEMQTRGSSCQETASSPLSEVPSP